MKKKSGTRPDRAPQCAVRCMEYPGWAARTIPAEARARVDAARTLAVARQRVVSHPAPIVVIPRFRSARRAAGPWRAAPPAPPAPYRACVGRRGRALHPVAPSEGEYFVISYHVLWWLRQMQKSSIRRLCCSTFPRAHCGACVSTFTDCRVRPSAASTRHAICVRVRSTVGAPRLHACMHAISSTCASSWLGPQPCPRPHRRRAWPRRPQLPRRAPAAPPFRSGGPSAGGREIRR